MDGQVNAAEAGFRGSKEEIQLIRLKAIRSALESATGWCEHIGTSTRVIGIDLLIAKVNLDCIMDPSIDPCVIAPNIEGPA
jgi:hypothetical protein